MTLTVAEKIRVILARRKLSMAQLAKLLGTTRQNFHHKMSRDNFTEQEIRQIAEALDCDFTTIFTLRDTGETL